MSIAAIHSCVISPHLKDHMVEVQVGKYGRMFPDLPAPDDNETALLALGRAGSVMDDTDMSEEGTRRTDNPRIPAGFTFLGQFVAHDITADRSLLLNHARVEELRNFRIPRLDLELLYGAGPGGEPFLYDLNDLDKLLIGINDARRPEDVPRNQQGRALIGDPRNDVHMIISQLHVAFLKFHNAIVDVLRKQGVPTADVFNRARQLARWHYQWIVVNEFLPLTVGDEMVDDILTNGLKFYSYENQVIIPVEFADAAYRYGHSQIRVNYVLNSLGAHGQVFPDCAGTCPVPHERVIEWSYFFLTDPQRPPQPSKRIDTLVADSMIRLPISVTGETEIPEQSSIAYRDLERGRALNLPSGEAIARAIGVEPLSREEVGLSSMGVKGETPLWYYILRESEVRYNGERLGDVGGRIVAEVLIGLLAADSTSYFNVGTVSQAVTDVQWQPTLPGVVEGDFTMTDLLRFAGVA